MNAVCQVASIKRYSKSKMDFDGGRKEVLDPLDTGAQPGPIESLGEYATDYDATTERRVRRKLDLYMMALFFILYMFAFLDQNNIGNARIAGMTYDLQLGAGDRYTWLVTIFFIAYIIFEFSLLLWKVFPPHIICGTVVLAW